MSPRSRVVLAVALGTALVSGCKRHRPEPKTDAPAPPASAPVATEGAPQTAKPPPPPVAVPNGYFAVRVAGVTHMPGGGDAVLLIEDSKRRAVPIFIGGTEALSIQLRLNKKEFARPLTHDLLDSSIEKLGGRVESVRVDKIENNTFFGTVILVAGSQRHEIDARPSDAIAIAVGNGLPVHVSSKVLDHAGMNLDDVPEERVEDMPAHGRPPPVTL